MRVIKKIWILVLLATLYSAAATIHALEFKENGTSNSDVRVIWSGSNLLPRVGHTAIWRYYPYDQSSFYAVAWHAPNDGQWDNGGYSYGTHPFPANDGTVDATGEANNRNSASSIQFWEEAGLVGASAPDPGSGLAGFDYISSAGYDYGSDQGLQVVKNQWYVQVRKCRLVSGGPHDGEYEHVFIPDLIGHPSFQIQQFLPDIKSGGASPAFYFGASDWTASGSTNTETPFGRIRGIQLYDTFLSDADHATEAANSTLNAAQTSAGQAALWYINQDPTPSDVADKKTGGTAHNPSWANANRPDQWDSTIASTKAGRVSLLGVGGN